MSNLVYYGTYVGLPLIGVFLVFSFVWPTISGWLAKLVPSINTGPVSTVVNVSNTTVAVVALETAQLQFWRAGDTESVNALAALRAKAVAWSTTPTPVAK